MNQDFKQFPEWRSVSWRNITSSAKRWKCSIFYFVPLVNKYTICIRFIWDDNKNFIDSFRYPLKTYAKKTKLLKQQRKLSFIYLCIKTCKVLWFLTYVWLGKIWWNFRCFVQPFANLMHCILKFMHAKDKRKQIQN